MFCPYCKEPLGGTESKMHRDLLVHVACIPKEEKERSLLRKKYSFLLGDVFCDLEINSELYIFDCDWSVIYYSEDEEGYISHRGNGFDTKEQLELFIVSILQNTEYKVYKVYNKLTKVDFRINVEIKNG